MSARVTNKPLPDSTVIVWEILAKAKAGKLHFSGDPESSLRQHLTDLRSSILPLRLDHVYTAHRLELGARRNRRAPGYQTIKLVLARVRPV